MDFDILNETITPLNTTLMTISGTGALGIPSGTTAQRPGSASAGALRWNTSAPGIEYFNGSTWIAFGGGTVTSVGLSLPSIFTVTGTPVTSSGTLTATLNTQSINTVLAGPTIGSPAVPTFRTLGLATNDMNDVLITSATSGQVLAYTGTNWVNTTVGTASYSTTVGPAGTIAWSGTGPYTAVITHNLGTQNVVVQTTDVSNNQVVFTDLITITSSTQITVQVSGTGSNLKTIRVVIIANGASIAAGGSTPSSILVTANGTTVTGGPFTTLNFTGFTTTPTGTGGTATINLGTTLRTLSYFAASLDSPNNSDWTVNALAPAVADPTYNGLTVRQYSNTTETGAGMFVPIPAAATNISFTYKGRSASATAGTLQMRFYARNIAAPTPAAVTSWSAANNFTSVSSPANVFYQTFTYTASLTSLSLTAGSTYQFELTRNVGVAGNLAAIWYLLELDIAFT